MHCNFNIMKSTVLQIYDYITQSFLNLCIISRSNISSITHTPSVLLTFHLTNYTIATHVDNVVNTQPFTIMPDIPRLYKPTNRKCIDYSMNLQRNPSACHLNTRVMTVFTVARPDQNYYRRDQTRMGGVILCFASRSDRNIPGTSV